MSCVRSKHRPSCVGGLGLGLGLERSSDVDVDMNMNMDVLTGAAFENGNGQQHGGQHGTSCNGDGGHGDSNSYDDATILQSDFLSDDALDGIMHCDLLSSCMPPHPDPFSPSGTTTTTTTTTTTAVNQAQLQQQQQQVQQPSSSSAAFNSLDYHHVSSPVSPCAEDQTENTSKMNNNSNNNNSNHNHNHTNSFNHNHNHNHTNKRRNKKRSVNTNGNSNGNDDGYGHHGLLSPNSLKEQRAKRNRESARRSRIKHKMYLNNLESKYFAIRNENNSLKMVIEQLLPPLLHTFPTLKSQLEALFQLGPTPPLPSSNFSAPMPQHELLRQQQH